MFPLSFPRLLSIPASTGLDGDDFVRVARQLLPRCVFSPEMVLSKLRDFGRTGWGQWGQDVGDSAEHVLTWVSRHRSQLKTPQESPRVRTGERVGGSRSVLSSSLQKSVSKHLT